jgi:hypothetical protein
VVAGRRLVDADADRHAKTTIARELGHARIDVASAYLGGSR